MRRAKKLVNFRLPFASAVALACGVGLSYIFAKYGVDYFWLLAAVPAAALAFIACNIFCRSATGIVYCIIVIAFFALGAAYAAITLSSYASAACFSDEIATVTGVVRDVRYTSSGSPYLIIAEAEADGVPLEGKVIVYLGENAGGAVAAGYKVNVFGSISSYDLFSYGSLNYNVLSGVRYYVSAYGTMQYTYGFSFFGALRSGIYDILFDNLDYETAAVAYAMITGATQDMSEGTLAAFRYGGVSHIFAVSGLNITVLYVAVTAVFKFCRANKWLSASVSLIVIFVYTGLCSFTLSAVRAAIMCAVGAIASLAYRKNDGLNSLSVSVILILLADPLNLFDVGFILSVCAMLGIILLTPNINRVLRRLPDGIKSNISMSLSSQIATLPALLLTFGYISGAGLILNIVVLPVLSFLYIFLFACVVLCAVVPAITAFVIPAAGVPLEAVINFFVGFGFEDSLISGFGGWWVVIIVFAGVAALSDKFNFSKSFRAAAAGICAACFALCCTLGGAVFGGETRIVAAGYYGGGMVLVRSNSGTALIIVEDTYAGGMAAFINTYAPEGVDDIIIVGGDGCATYYYECGAEAENVWISPSTINLPALDGTTVHYEQSFELGGTYYEFIDSYTLTASANGVTFAVCCGGSAPEFCDLLFTAGAQTSGEANTTVYFSGGGGDFDLYVQGRLQFIANGGRLLLTGIISE